MRLCQTWLRQVHAPRGRYAQPDYTTTELMVHINKEHEDFTIGVVRLMVWHVWSLAFKTNPAMPLAEALDQRVDICRKTTGSWPGAFTDAPNQEWNRLRTILGDRIEKHASATDTSDIENECWGILGPLVQPKIVEDSLRIREWMVRPFRCWTYGMKDENRIVDIHFFNASRPESPFSKKNWHHTASDLLALLLEVREIYPDAEQVRCSSWLCCFPPFLGFFPDEWTESFRPVFGGYPTAGWWGQYMDHQGAFHSGNARSFRKNGYHPYTCGEASCSFGRAIDYLRDVNAKSDRADA